MTIKKNQHRKDILVLSFTTLIALVSLSSAQVANAETEARPSAAAKQKFQERMNLKAAAQAAQSSAQLDLNKVVINFVPETSYATQFLSKKVDVFVADDRGKVSMTAEAAMHEYLKQFDRAMSNAKKFEVSRDGAFADVSHKVNAKAFDEAVGRARLAMSRYRLLQTELGSNLLKSFGPLRDLVPKEEMKLAEQGKGLSVGNMADLVRRMDIHFSSIPTVELERGGATVQYRELLDIQKRLKSVSSQDPTVRPDTFLNDNLNVIRQVEAKGVEVARKATIVDVANFNRMSPDHKKNLEKVQMRQPVGLQVQRALDKVPRAQLASGRVTLLAGAIGFTFSNFAKAGEAEPADTMAVEAPTEFKRDWARSGTPVSH